MLLNPYRLKKRVFDNSIIDEMVFLLSVFTAVVSLLWSIQLFAIIHSEPVILWLNISMIVSWLTLCAAVVHKQFFPTVTFQLRMPLSVQLRMPLLVGTKYSKIVEMSEIDEKIEIV